MRRRKPRPGRQPRLPRPIRPGHPKTHPARHKPIGKFVSETLRWPKPSLCEINPARLGSRAGFWGTCRGHNWGFGLTPTEKTYYIVRLHVLKTKEHTGSFAMLIANATQKRVPRAVVNHSTRAGRRRHILPAGRWAVWRRPGRCFVGVRAGRRAVLRRGRR